MAIPHTPPSPPERIVHAAIQLLPQLGTRGASVKRICARAEVGSGLFHYYFPDKRSLYLAVVAELGRRLQARLDHDDLDGWLSAALARGDAADAAAVGAWNTLVGEASQHEEIGVAVAERAQQMQRTLSSLLAAAGSPTPDPHAAILWCFVMGAWSALHLPGTLEPGSALPLARRLVADWCS